MQDYRAPRWLSGDGAIGGNAQTIWPALFGRRFEGSRPVFERERWTAPDGDFIDVDWLATIVTGASGSTAFATAPPVVSSTAAPTASSGSIGSAPAARAASTGQPLMVLFHGLEGSSASHYAQAFAHTARQRGWRFAVPHFRGCSGEINLAPRAYHSGDFAEVGWIIERFAAVHAGPIAAVGVSLGGNALLRWAEEAGASAARTVAAVASVSAPLDLAAGGDAIGRGFNRLVYTRMFLRTMRAKGLAKWAQHPGLFDRERLLAARDLRAFDDVFTGPLHGFTGVDDYWKRASAKPALADIRIPALVMNALNDPFVPGASLPPKADVGRHVVLWQPAHGGHVGFPGGTLPGHVLTLPQQVTKWLAARLPSTDAATSSDG